MLNVLSEEQLTKQNKQVLQSLEIGFDMCLLPNNRNNSGKQNKIPEKHLNETEKEFT